MTLSRAVSAIEPSATFAIKARASELSAEGREVVDLSAGEPDFAPPAAAVEAAAEALRTGQHSYGPVAGLPSLRSAVAARYASRGLSVSAANVMVTHGGKQALANLAAALFNPGDEVIVLAPYWVSYLPQLRFFGVEPVVVNTRPEDGFQPDPEAVAAAVTERTRGLIINSPNNPTGAVASRDRLVALMELARRADLQVISDEIYDAMTYDGVQATCVPTLSEDAARRTTIVHAVSKSFGLTGWRIGWMVGSPELVAGCSALQGHTTSGVTRILQLGAAAALTSGWQPGPILDGLAERRDRLVAGLTAIDGFEVGPVPQGAFYLFPRVDGFFGRRRADGRQLSSAMDVASFLIEEVGVATVPGEAFGEPRCVRLSYAVSPETIEAGVGKLEQAPGKLA